MYPGNKCVSVCVERDKIVCVYILYIIYIYICVHVKATYVHINFWCIVSRSLKNEYIILFNKFSLIYSLLSICFLFMLSFYHESLGHV